MRFAFAIGKKGPPLSDDVNDDGSKFKCLFEQCRPLAPWLEAKRRGPDEA